MTFTIRVLTLDHVPALAHILVTANEHAFRGLLPDETLNFTEAESAANWRHFLEGEGLPEGDFMLVAQAENGEVVGYIWGGRNKKEDDFAGELRQINILPAYQRQGIGRLLACHLARRFVEQGIRSLRVETLQINPNRPFYERLGGVFVREFPYEGDVFTVPAYVYGWADIQTLLAHCHAVSAS
jgi:ribosomal protein S18 acetylase RimI-like enzyme